MNWKRSELPLLDVDFNPSTLLIYCLTLGIMLLAFNCYNTRSFGMLDNSIMLWEMSRVPCYYISVLSCFLKHSNIITLNVTNISDKPVKLNCLQNLLDTKQLWLCVICCTKLRFVKRIELPYVHRGKKKKSILMQEAQVSKLNLENAGNEMIARHEYAERLCFLSTTVWTI